MRREPMESQLYRHFKGNVYRVICVAQHTESGEKMVVYTRNDIQDKCYVRPLEMFLSEVDAQKYPDVKEKYRFTRVDSDGMAINDDSDGGSEESDNEDEMDYDNATISLHPKLEAFLDASGYEEKLEKFYDMRSVADAGMLSYVAMSLDIELSKEDIDEQYIEILGCLRTMAKYDSSRLRK